MSIKDDAQRIHANLLEKTDPEAVERINHFAFDEVQADVDLPDSACKSNRAIVSRAAL